MRGLALVLTIAVAGAAAWGAAAADRERLACGARTIDVYFWPRGHGALLSVGFPAFRRPHVEVYRAGDTSDRTGFLAFMSSTETSLGRSCSRVRNTRRKPGWAGGPSVSTARPRRVRCTLPRPAELVLAERITEKGFFAGFQLDITLGHTRRTVVSVQVNRGPSHALRYAKSACRKLQLPS